MTPARPIRDLAWDVYMVLGEKSLLRLQRLVPVSLATSLKLFSRGENEPRNGTVELRLIKVLQGGC